MHSGEFVIKSFADRYKKEMVELYMRAYRGLEVYAYKGKEDVSSYIDWLEKRDRGGIFLAFKDDRLVGFIASDAKWFSKREGKVVGAIHELVVDETYRRKGVATLLMNEAIDYFRKRGLDMAELWVGDENETARKFYKKFGFRESGRYNYWIRMVRSLREDG